MARAKLGRTNTIEQKIAAMKRIIAIDAKQIHKNKDLTKMEELSGLVDENLSIIAPKMKLKFSDISLVFRSTALLIIQRTTYAGLGQDKIMPIIDESAYEETLEEWCYNPTPLELEYEKYRPLEF